MSERKQRFGILKIFVGTTHMVKGPDGVQRQFRVGDKTRGNSKDLTCVCLKCQQTYADEATMRAAHADEHVLRKQSEAHPFGWWNNTPKTKEDKDPGRVIGLLSDEYLDA